jgi:hypothetical protein
MQANAVVENRKKILLARDCKWHTSEPVRNCSGNGAEQINHREKGQQQQQDQGVKA